MEHELTMVKGIGPKTAFLLVSAGIGTLKELARLTSADVDRLRHVEPGLEHGDFDDWIKQAKALVDEEEAAKSSATGAAALETGGETETETEPGPVAADAGATGPDAEAVAAGQADGASAGDVSDADAGEDDGWINYELSVEWAMEAPASRDMAAAQVAATAARDLQAGVDVNWVPMNVQSDAQELFAFIKENPDAPVEALHMHARMTVAKGMSAWEATSFPVRLGFSIFRHVALEILAERKREAQAAAAAERKRIDAELRAASAILAPNTGMHGPQPDDHLSYLGKAAARRAARSGN